MAGPVHAFYPVIVAASVTALLTLLIRAVAVRLAFVVPPRRDRWHRSPVPLLGGVGIWAGTAVATAVFASSSSLHGLTAVIACGLAAFLIGLVDDGIPLKPATKLTGQIAAGCIAVGLGASGTWTGSPALDGLLTIIWVVAITNAFNLLDNMDGLCAGVGAIGAGWVCVSLGLGDGPSFVYAAALAGACLGFLLFNFSPATIFMGDSGSLFIGASLALLALDVQPGRQSGFLVSMGVPALLLLIPIFDSVFVTLSRKLASRSPAVGGRDHTSHRLVALGFSERQAVLMLYLLAGIGGGAAVALESTRFRESHVVAALMVIGLVLLATQLARVRVYEGKDFAALRGKAFTPLLVDFTYKRRIFEVLLDLTLVVVAYYGAYVIRFDRELPLYTTLIVQSLPVIIGVQLVSFFVAGVYRGVWHYFTISDLVTYLKGVMLGTVASVIALVYLFRFEGYSRMVFIIDAMLLLLLIVGSRYSFRVLGDLAARRTQGSYRVLIYGAGAAGALLVGELRRNPLYDYSVIGFLDDDPSKDGKQLAGCPVFGGAELLPALVAEHGVDLIIVSTQKLTHARLEQLREICFQSGTGILQFDFALRPIPTLPSRV